MGVSWRQSFVAILLLVNSLAASPQPDDMPARVPVVVELFTSEGCSSCPPADALLLNLDLAQPVSGADVIALGEHVDYWNDLGWKDRFSSAKYSDRQSRYAAHFGRNSVYTPQMVINGREEFVGNDAAMAAKSIAQAAHPPGPSAVVSVAFASDAVDVKVTNAGRNSRDVMLAVTESGLSTQVGQGENHGRLLRHTAVVRELRRIGTTIGGTFAMHYRLSLRPDWRRQNLRVVIFLQDPWTLEISGAAQATLK